MVAETSRQYDEAIAACKDIFLTKMKDYGCAWRILRPSSITDQITIKAKRIRNIQEMSEWKVDEGQWEEFLGIVNYATMALIQLEKGADFSDEITRQEVTELYDRYITTAKSLMGDKNHDYNEAWRDMRVSSLTDIILMKLLRIKEIENNSGNTLISEGLDANYLDIINYAVFALIKLKAGES